MTTGSRPTATTPHYNTYAYEEPIYGYGDLEPGQVIANVQTALQKLGYYR